MTSLRNSGVIQEFCATGYLTELQWESNDLERADLIVRAMTARDLLAGCSSSPWPEIYERMQIARIGQQTTENFKKLLDSVSWRGFNPSFPIKVNQNGHLIDGSHRLSIAIVLGLRHVPVEIVNGPANSYGFDFLGSHLPEPDVMMIRQAESELMSLAGMFSVAIVFPPAMAHFESIVGKVHEFGTVFAVSKVTIDSKIQDFVLSMYESDEVEKFEITSKTAFLDKFAPQFGVINVYLNKRDLRIKGLSRSSIMLEAERLKAEILQSVGPNVDGHFHNVTVHVGQNHFQNRHLCDLIRKVSA